MPVDHNWFDADVEKEISEENRAAFHRDVESICKKAKGAICAIEVHTENDGTFEIRSAGPAKEVVKKSTRTYDELLYRWQKFMRKKREEWEKELKDQKNEYSLTKLEMKWLDETITKIARAGEDAVEKFKKDVEDIQTEVERVAFFRDAIKKWASPGWTPEKAFDTVPMWGRFIEWVNSEKSTILDCFDDNLLLASLSNPLLQRRFIAAMAADCPKVKVSNGTELLVESYPELDNVAHEEVDLEKHLKDAPKLVVGFWFSEVKYTLMESDGVKEKFFKFVSDHMIEEWQPAMDKLSIALSKDIGTPYTATFKAWNGELFLTSYKPNR